MSGPNRTELPDAASYPYNRFVAVEFVEPHWRTRQLSPLSPGTIKHVIYEKRFQEVAGKRFEYWQEACQIEGHVR